MSFRLFSDDLKEGDFLGAAQVFNGFGHSGTNISPQLAWSDPPPGTQSFVITMFDPDAPTGVFIHWVLCNLPAGTRRLAEGVPRGERLADGVTKVEIVSRAQGGKGDFGRNKRNVRELLTALDAELPASQS